MFKSRSVLAAFKVLFAMLSLVLAGLASAAVPGAEPFTEARFRALQADNALILIDVAADWCPTCRRQQAALASFQARHPEAKLNILTVDFDDQKEWVRHFKAPRQSTLILFKGPTQQWLLVAESREEVLSEQILAASRGGAVP